MIYLKNRENNELFMTNYTHAITAQHSTAQHSTAQHSTAQHSTKLTPRPPFIAGLLLLGSLLLSALALPPVFAQSKDEITLPDLGTPAANTGSVQPNINAQGGGFNYRDNINGKLISITPQYNEQNGTSLGGSLAGALTKNMAVGVLLSVGSDRNEWLLNTGFD